MSYDEFKQLYRKTWDEDYNYLCIDRSEKGDQGRYCICNESKNTYIECTPETKNFGLSQLLYSIKNREVLENLEELVSLINQVEEVRLQEKVGEQSFHEITKKNLNPLLIQSKLPPKTLTESSAKNNKAPENLNVISLEILNDRGIMASYLSSPLSKITNPEKTSQFNLLKDPNSNRAIYLLIPKTIPVTLDNIFVNIPWYTWKLQFTRRSFENDN